MNEYNVGYAKKQLIEQQISKIESKYVGKFTFLENQVQGLNSQLIQLESKISEPAKPKPATFG